jgi:dTMP kinase
MTGKFIVLEGPDCCGKGTQHRLLADYLMNHQKDNYKSITVIATREPYAAPGNKKVCSNFAEIRRIMRTNKDVKADAQKLAELFVKNRMMHAGLLIKPNLELGHIVVCDRYWHSTEAYQSAQGLDICELRKMRKGLPVPDLTFFINVPVEERMKRKAYDGQRSYDEVFEMYNEFQELLDEKYALLAELGEANAEGIVCINGSRRPELVFKDIAAYVDALLCADAIDIMNAC